MHPLLRHIVQVLAIVFLATLALASSAHADGIYIPQKAYPTLPTIPMQRAIIIHRDGSETLIVESAFESQSPEVAWILPLPAAPTKLELTEAGAISSTAYSLRPAVVHDLHGLIKLPFTICLLILPLALAAMFIRERAARSSVLKNIIFVEIFLVFISSILLPSLGGAGTPVATSDLPGLSILSTQRLGDADFTVLNAATPEVLDQWLNSQELRPLDATAKPIMADYIARHWCFVVGKLHNASAKLSAPRPLKATFPATEPVFPMKLTALANTTTHVELCVFATAQAAAPGFHCVIADKFMRQPSDPDLTHYPARSAYYFTYNSHASLGHPDIVPLLWANCTATKLVADLPPAKMDQDITIQLQPLTPHRDSFYSSLARQQIALALLCAGMAIFLIFAAVFLRGRRRPTPWQFKFLTTTLLVVFIVPAVAWQFLPTIPVHVGSHSARFLPRVLSAAVSDLVKKNILPHDPTPEQIASIPQILVSHDELSPEILTNPYTGQPIRVECSPGNYTVRTLGDKTYFCTYDENGIETRMPLP